MLVTILSSAPGEALILQTKNDFSTESYHMGKHRGLGEALE